MAEWFHNDGQNKGKVCKTVVRLAMMYRMRMVRWLSGFTMMGRIRNPYLYRRVCVCVCILPSVYTSPSVVRSEPKFGTHMQIHLEKVVGKIKICPV